MFYSTGLTVPLIILEGIWLKVSNALAYCIQVLTAEVRCFILQAPQRS